MRFKKETKLTGESWSDGARARKITAASNLILPHVVAIDSIVAVVFLGVWAVAIPSLKDW